MPQYHDCTTIVLTPDHGRGVTQEDWNGHGKKIPHSEETWLAVYGPDTPKLGERRESVAEVHQAQVAATVAALLGEDFRAAFPAAAAPVRAVVSAGADK